MPSSADAVWTRLASLPPVAEPASMRAATLVPLYEDPEGDVRIVLTKRPDTMRTHAGDVVFPGGRVEAGESAAEAAIREAWEEVALPPESVDVIGGLEPVTTRSRDMWIVPVVARIERPPVLVPDPSEVDAIIEPTLAELLDEDRWTTNDWYGHPLWFYEFPEGTLWGATAFMMRDLLDYLRP
jgi:8-oxo-dGTP pyrophosphatase MutT (NUDIX family)